jgi:hypothetical protein
VVGRCIYGAVLDRELGDMMPRDEQGKVLSLARDLERHFLYARYDADRTEVGLQRLGLSNIDAELARRLDAVARVDHLVRIGHAAAHGSPAWRAPFPHRGVPRLRDSRV